jgi:AAA+ ATPase superfamily predicted ATPase
MYINHCLKVFYYVLYYCHSSFCLVLISEDFLTFSSPNPKQMLNLKYISILSKKSIRYTCKNVEQYINESIYKTNLNFLGEYVMSKSLMFVVLNGPKAKLQVKGYHKKGHHAWYMFINNECDGEIFIF